MSNAELIQAAIEYLQKCGRQEQYLDTPRIRETAIVYLKLKPRGNCMVSVDRETGEIVGAMFTMGEALLPEYEPSIRLHNEARAIAAQSREGACDRIPEGGTEPRVFDADLVEGLARRCPGWPGADYGSALADAFRELDFVQQAGAANRH